MLKLFFNILFIITLCNLYAQDSATFKPGVFIGFDLARPAIALYNPEQHTYEASLDWRFTKKYMLSFEVGTTTIDLDKQSYSYKSEGNYYRMGINYNFLKLSPDWDRGMFTVGLKYGMSNLKHYSPQLTIDDRYWTIYKSSLPESKINSQWIELSTSLRTEILKNIYLGYTLKMNFIVKTDNNGSMKPYYIPGYGKGVFTSFPLINYYIYYMIPYRK